MRLTPVALLVLAGLTAFLGFAALANAASSIVPNKTCANPGVVCPDPLFHNGFDGLDPDGDEDGDGLPNRVETNTGVYVSPEDTGTDPYNRDTDGDGLSDGDEVHVTAAGLDLPSMGVNPLHKDLLIEYDWFDDAIGGPSHSHKPTQAELDGVAAVFANAPVSNPDGRPGIHVIQDVGQGYPFTGGELITNHSPIIQSLAPGDDYETVLRQHMDINRLTRFHYVLMAHAMAGTDSGGSAEIVGFRVMTALSVYTAHRRRQEVDAPTGLSQTERPAREAGVSRFHPG